MFHLRRSRMRKATYFGGISSIKTNFSRKVHALLREHYIPEVRLKIERTKIGFPIKHACFYLGPLESTFNY